MDQPTLPIGHSVRNTYRLPHAHGVTIQPKAFVIGTRIEYSQTLINEVRYKMLRGHSRPSTVEYRLAHATSNGRGAYTFCMCPGGSVALSTSMEGGVVVSEMSEHTRDREDANSTPPVWICPEDHGEYVLDGITYQGTLGKRALVLGGGIYRAPV